MESPPHQVKVHHRSKEKPGHRAVEQGQGGRDYRQGLRWRKRGNGGQSTTGSQAGGDAAEVAVRGEAKGARGRLRAMGEVNKITAVNGLGRVNESGNRSSAVKKSDLCRNSNEGKQKNTSTCTHSTMWGKNMMDTDIFTSD